VDPSIAYQVGFAIAWAFFEIASGGGTTSKVALCGGSLSSLGGIILRMRLQCSPSLPFKTGIPEVKSTSRNGLKFAAITTASHKSKVINGMAMIRGGEKRVVVRECFARAIRAKQQQLTRKLGNLTVSVHLT
jgi:hypothetical protein